MNFEEKTIDSREIYKGRIIEVRLDRVLLPDGRESQREIVTHSGAVAIIAIDADNCIWMVRQYRKAAEKVLLEIPAGTLQKNEDPLECAQRELREETGLEAGVWEKILYYYSAPGFCTEKLHMFLARDLVKGQATTDEDEILEATRISLKDAYDYIFQGKIIDGKSIIGIQYAFNKLFGE